MVRLRTLGALDLTDGDHAAELRTLLRQPKRIAVLVYLRMHASIGPVRRDTLLGMFWPESSSDRGRHALSQMLYVLRRSLGDTVLNSNGSEAISVDPTHLACDVEEFEQALAREELETALAVYRGDLLAGFFVPDAPEFERWVDTERARLRRLAAGAARTLAERDAATGNLTGAVHWSRREAELAPYDEHATTRLIQYLMLAGDRSGARHAFREYRDRLRADLEIEPPEDVARALDNPQVRGGRTESEWSADPSGGEPNEGEAVAAERSPASAVPLPRRTLRWWAAAFMVGAAAVIAAMVLRDRSPADAPTDVNDGPPRILIAEIANRTEDPELDALARMAGDWLSSELARTGSVRVVPAVLALQLIDPSPTSDDTSGMARLVMAGADASASLVLGGTLVGTAEAARFEVFGVEPRTGEITVVLDPIPVSHANPEPALEQLREATVVALAVRFDSRLRQWMGRASQPPNYVAYRRYSDALDLFLEGSWAGQEEATNRFIDLWRQDSTFTTPLLLALFGMMNTDQGDRADSLVHALEPYGVSLPEWEAAMLQYFVADLHGNLGERFRWSQRAVSLVPNSEWRFILAGAARDVGCRQDALAIMEELDPASGWMARRAPAYWTVRLDLRHASGDVEGEARDFALARGQLSDELYPGHGYRALAAGIRAAARAGDADRLGQLLGEAQTLGSYTARVYLKLLTWGPADLPAKSQGHRIILDSAFAWMGTLSPGRRANCSYRDLKFTLLYHAGRWDEADRAFEELAADDCLPYPQYALYRAPLAAHLGAADRARAIADSFPWATHMKSIALADEDFWKARVEAVLGQPAQAVAHLRRANGRGIPFTAVLEGTARVDFDAIWEYPPLQRLLADRRCADDASSADPRTAAVSRSSY